MKVSKLVIIGPFRRRAFAEGLARLLGDEPDLRVQVLQDEAEAAGWMAAETPTIVILESREDRTPSGLVPTSECVAVIFVEQEGKDVQIALHRLDRTRLRNAIGLITETPHPKVVALDADVRAQPILLMPRHGRVGSTGLSFVLDWLDAAFYMALGRFSEQREEASGQPWMQDLEVLRRSFCRNALVTERDVDARLEALCGAPFWREHVIDRFALDAVEIRLLCVAAAPDLDQRYRQAIGLMQGNYAEGRPNASTLAAFLGSDRFGADVLSLLAGRRAFARLGFLLSEAETAPQPGFRVAPAVFDMLLGIRRRAGARWRLQDHALPADDRLTASLKKSLAGQAPSLVLAGGAEGADPGAEMAAALVEAGSPVLRASCRGVTSEEVPGLVRDWALRARLQDAALMIEGLDSLPAEVHEALLGVDLNGLVPLRVLVADKISPAADALHLSVPQPGLGLRARRWRAAAADHGLFLDDEAASQLAGTLRFAPDTVDAVARMAASRAAGADPAALILHAARHVAAAHAPETVRRGACVFGWDDIALPATVMQAVRAVPEHVRQSAKVLDTWGFAARLPYGRGVGALFSGPSGTGKTMCAQVIAAELGVELMQVEISRCVSKYIGETEKNIDRCFVAAEAASAVLLFDEGDALFGKRTEIKDAHDRHANVEVAYLLQRIEAYEGLVILTTNFKANIDAAFLRRLRFVVDFPMPAPEDRERIWQLAFPRPEVCAGDLDTAFLARRLPLSGGSIQSIAVNAAFDAAAEGCELIHMRHVMAATRVELVKNGMLSAEKALADPDPMPRLERLS